MYCIVDSVLCGGTVKPVQTSGYPHARFIKARYIAIYQFVFYYRRYGLQFLIDVFIGFYYRALRYVYPVYFLDKFCRAFQRQMLIVLVCK